MLLHVNNVKSEFVGSLDEKFVTCAMGKLTCVPCKLQVQHQEGAATKPVESVYTDVVGPVNSFMKIKSISA